VVTKAAPEDFGIGRLFRHVRDGVIVANASTERIVLWNDCARAIFGYAEDEALRLELHALVPARLRPAHRAGLARYQAGGTGDLLESGRPAELWGLHRSGREVPIELTLTAIPERGPGGERFALAIVRDASDRRAAEEARLRIARADDARQQAFEFNDAIVQGLVAAKAALELGRIDDAQVLVSNTLDRAKAIVAALVSEITEGHDLGPGDLVRDSAAVLSPDEKPADGTSR
jgi:PAS domain S-box-containing protein